MKSISNHLSKQFVLYGAIGAAIAGIILGGLYTLHKNSLVLQVMSDLNRNISGQVDRILPALLLPEQSQTLNAILQDIATEEKLDSIRFLEQNTPLDRLDDLKCRARDGYLTCDGSNPQEVVLAFAVRIDSKVYGYLIKERSIDLAVLRDSYLRISLVAVILSFLSLIIVLLRLAKRVQIEVADFLESFNKWLRLSLRDKTLPEVNETHYLEFASLKQIVRDFLEDHNKVSREAAYASVARQVAHDIRSPLTALEVSSKGLDGASEEQRLLFRGAVKRIRDIVGSLDDRSLHSKGFQQSESIEYLPELIEDIIQEKRAQIQTVKSIQFDVDYPSGEEDGFASIIGTDFRRLISNLLDNSIESISQKGSISVHVQTLGGVTSVTVRDSGRGIPPEVLPSLGKLGHTFGKRAGTGLGLYHARECVSSWGGSLSIRSQPGVGTEVTLLLKRSEKPTWFAKSVPISKTGRLISIDDDPLIQKTLEMKVLDEGNIGSVSFTSFRDPDEFNNFLINGGVREDDTLLFDYQFGSKLQTGLDLIRSARLTKQSLLVTSHSDDPAVREKCKELGVRMLPKNQIPYVAFRLRSLES